MDFPDIPGQPRAQEKDIRVLGFWGVRVRTLQNTGISGGWRAQVEKPSAGRMIHDTLAQSISILKLKIK